MCLSNSRNFYASSNYDKAIWLLKSGRLSLAGPEVLDLVSHCSSNFQPIFDCFLPNFKLNYEDTENINADRVNTVILNLHQFKRWAFFLGHPVSFQNRQNQNCQKYSLACAFVRDNFAIAFPNSLHETTIFSYKRFLHPYSTPDKP